MYELNANHPALSSLAAPLKKQACTVLEESKGMHFQLFNALRQTQRRWALVEMWIPNLDKHFEMQHQRNILFKALENQKTWQWALQCEMGQGGTADCPDKSLLHHYKQVAELRLKGLWIAGTINDQVIGGFMLRHGLLVPTACASWGPNLRFFELSPKGQAMRELFALWWSKQPLHKKTWYFVAQ